MPLPHLTFPHRPALLLSPTPQPPVLLNLPGPTFRAENSHTARHLAEFWMIEPEMAFCDLTDDMACAEDYVRHCCAHLLAHCRADLDFIVSMVDKGAIARLEQVASTPFKRVSYTEAIEILEGVVAAGKKTFEYAVSWGIDLSSEHERYLTEEVFGAPIIVYNYPKEIKVGGPSGGEVGNGEAVVVGTGWGPADGDAWCIAHMCWLVQPVEPGSVLAGQSAPSSASAAPLPTSPATLTPNPPAPPAPRPRRPPRRSTCV